MGLSQYGEVGGVAGLGELGNPGWLADKIAAARAWIVARAARITAEKERAAALAAGKTPAQAQAEATAAATATGQAAARAVDAEVSASLLGMSPAKIAAIAAGVAVVGGGIYYLTKK